MVETDVYLELYVRRVQTDSVLPCSVDQRKCNQGGVHMLDVSEIYQIYPAVQVITGCLEQA